MDNHFIKFVFTIALLPSLYGCIGLGGVDHTGIGLNPDDGFRHLVECDISVDHDNEIGAPVSSRVNIQTEICSRSNPSEDRMQLACDAAIASSTETLAIYFPGYDPVNRPGMAQPVQSTSIDDDALCSITEFNGEDSIIISEPLISSSTISSSSVITDYTGRINGKTSLTNSQLAVANSNIKVGVKLAKWRYGNTSATGAIDLDRVRCDSNDVCEIIIRSIDLDIRDFNIVRPTVFAGDVKIRDITLSSVKDYVAIVDDQGRFSVENLQVRVLSTINGDSVVWLDNRDFELKGKFSHNLHDQAHAPMGLTISLNYADSGAKIELEAQLNTHKLITALQNGQRGAKGTPLQGEHLCLVGGDKRHSHTARVAGCSNKKPYQAWSLKLDGNYLRIKRPTTNQCLSANKDGDGAAVKVDTCSDDFGQFWAIDNNKKVVHLLSQTCLDIYTKNSSNGVIVSRCDADSDSQRWEVIKPYY